MSSTEINHSISKYIIINYTFQIFRVVFMSQENKHAEKKIKTVVLFNFPYLLIILQE